ncbi:hypothetical protein BC829DRAFT_403428 [Chytridium lagenaria]|nr:hypothetical protein BC829DRAFT_403428 [Chytridium lagenaria]
MSTTASSNLFIGNLSDKANEEAVYGLFATYGAIRDDFLSEARASVARDEVCRLV